MSSSTSSSSSSSSSSVAEDKTAMCIRKVSNFSNMKPAFQIDHKAFNPELMNITIPEAAPKLAELFRKIEELDAKDMRKTGKLYKHFIYSDVLVSAFGAKLIASAFVSKGYNPAFTPSFAMKTDEVLKQTKDKNFGLLMSKSIYNKSMPVKFRKAMAAKYNERPENTNGELMRFIILDSGFREGIDLFDVKYVHLFEPLLVRADEKQSIGRATRFCGQKGLQFHPTFGWPLYVFRYDLELENSIEGANTMFELYLKYSDIDLRKVVFAAELEDVVIDASVDKVLNKEIHTFKIEQPPPVLAASTHSGGSLKTVSQDIEKNYLKYRYPHVKLENKCEEAPDQSVTFTPTQDFVRNYFTPKSKQKGMLLFHSVGSGKTCTAIATATSSFEKEGYTVVWVTRHTLKSDIWKNMFKQVCHMKFIEENKKFPAKVSAPMKHLSKQWIEPMSYKQFSNMLLKLNRFYKSIVDKNGEEDPLRKTLLIIDEAHKLYTATGPKSERPKMEVLEEMIQNSYEKSGKDSVRVLLMTATPYTEDPMEMIKLMNLLREDQIKNDFEGFSKDYLDKDGYFTRRGKTKFQDSIAGYVSYINRSQDARNFAHPIIEPVYVPVTYPETRLPTKEIDILIKKITAEMKDQRLILREEKAGCKEQIKEFRAECNGAYKEKIQETKDAMKEKKAGCGKNKDCIEKVKDRYTAILDKQKAGKKQFVKDCIEKNMQDQCSGIAIAQKALDDMKDKKAAEKAKIKEAMDRNKELTEQAKNIRGLLKEMSYDKKDLNNQKKLLRKKLKSDPSVIKEIKAINAKLKVIAKEYKEKRAIVITNNNNKKINRMNIGRAVLPDASVRTMLYNKCKI